ncbi:RHS repeat protein [Aquimarina latercula]|uniref:RHS repeat protein n=1 Tax=Aquimarina latercula TaxID=987 RepID=UPI0003F74745|nr:RHS repeat protein [Aquimarina latercula]
MKNPINKILRTSIFALFYLLLINTAKSQESFSALPGVDNTKGFLSNPSTGGFSNYSNTELVDLYTGMVDVSIPVYTIKSADLSVNLFLDYKKDGILVEEDASWVGLGWQLNGVGYIRREVRGNPDEPITAISEQGNVYYQNFGRFYGLIDVENFNNEIPLGNTGGTLIMDDYVDMIVNNDLFSCDLQQEQNGNLENCGEYCQMQLVDKIIASDGRSGQTFWNKHRDTEPDVFHYSTPTAFGSFILDRTGNPIILEGSTDVVIRPAIGPLANSSGWEIISNKGVVYTFPNTESFTETTKNSSLGLNHCSIWGFEGETKEQFKRRDISPTYNPVPGGTICNSRLENKVINTWYVSKMKSTKYDKEINFEYDSQGPIENYHLQEQRMEYVKSFTDSFTNIDACNPQQIENTTTSFTSFPTNSPAYNTFAKSGKSYWNPFLRTIENPKYIKRIRFSNGKVELYPSDNERIDMKENKALDRIIVFDNFNKQIKNFKFNYNSFIAQPYINAEKSTRLKLESFEEIITESESKRFSFEYEESLNLPSRGSFKQDYWGYYNNNSINSLIPATSRNGVSFSGANRKPDETRMKTAMLKKIIYPTGGHSEIFYEINTYRDREYRLNRPMGGLRVSKTITHDSSSSQNDIIKNYAYGEINASSGRSTNFLDINWWRHFQQDAYFTYWKFSSVWDRHLFVKRSSHNMYPFERTKGGLVGYDKVTVAELGNGKIVYTFRNPEDYPDEEANKIKYPQRDKNGSDLYHDNMHIPKDALRGLPVSITTYNKNGDIVSLTFNEYENNPTNHNQHRNNIIKVKRVSDYTTRYDINTGTFFGDFPEYTIDIGEVKSWFPYLKKSKTRTYDLLGNNYTEKTMTYKRNSNKHMQVTDTEIINSDNVVRRSKIYYPLDDYQINDLSNAEKDALNNLKLLNRMEPVLIVENNGSKQTSKIRHLYKENENNTNQVVVKASQFAKADTTFINRDIFYKYDETGHLLETSSSPKGAHTFYVWGYNDTYPIAKIENANYDQVIPLMGNLNLKGTSNKDNDRTIGNIGNEGKLRAALNKLRASLPKAIISTYTYDPLVGITSMTDPTGYTVYYNYDDFNRLKQVKDQDGNVLSENDYNYINN